MPACPRLVKNLVLLLYHAIGPLHRLNEVQEIQILQSHE